MNLFNKAAKWVGKTVERNKKELLIGAATLVGGPALGAAAAGAAAAVSKGGSGGSAPAAAVAQAPVNQPAVLTLGSTAAENEAKRAASTEAKVLGVPRTWAIVGGVVAVLLLAFVVLRPRAAAV